MRLILMDRWGVQKGTLHDLISATWTEELGGEDTLSLESGTPVAKGDRVVWLDEQGLWHEHIAAEVAQAHENGPVTYRVTGENSIAETYGDFVADSRPSGTAAVALASALKPTRWGVGRVTVEGSHSKTFYRTSARESLQAVIETWGGELSTTIEVEGCEVTGRKVNLTQRGADNGRRFTWSRDMTSITRTFSSDDVVTALYGFGKGEEVGDGYGRGIDFADVNGGKAYVEDADALELWGRPDGEGGKAHVFGVFEDSECTDPEELLSETEAELAERCQPKVSYEASVAAFQDYGYDFSGVALGDAVTLVDTEFEPELRVKGRVTRLVRDMLDGGRVTELAIGNIVEGVDALIAGQYAELKSLQSRATTWDVAASTPGAYIEQVIAGLNAKFDEGASYVYQSATDGIIVASVPLDQSTGLPTKTPASAIQLKGGGFRIADSLKGDGGWDWRTFGTGSGFTADEITAGKLVGGKSWWNLDDGSMSFEQGTIASADGNTSWDLTNGTMVLKGGLTISGGTIQSADGKNSWDLTTGAMTLSGDLNVTGGVFSSTDGSNTIDMDSNSVSMGSTSNTFDGGIIQSGNNYWNLNTGEMQIDFTPTGTIKNTLNSISSTASSAATTASSANSKATSAKLVTDRITFTSEGMKITGTDGTTSQVATYTADGFTVDAETCSIGSSSGHMDIKNWGFYFTGDGKESLWLTDGHVYGGGSHFRVNGDGWNFYINSSGVYFNDVQLATVSSSS